MSHPPVKSGTRPNTSEAATTARVKISSRGRATADCIVTSSDKVPVPTASQLSAFDTGMLDALNPPNREYNSTKEQLSFRSSSVNETTSDKDEINIDTDLSQESTRLQSLQIRQELRSQSLGIANQSPQVLLGVFKDS